MCSNKKVRDQVGHSMDGFGQNSNSMSWARLLGKTMIQILLNYLLGFEKVTKQIMM